MKVIEYIERAKETLISFEIIPPMRGRNAQDVYDVLDKLIEFRPPFIDVTSHAADAYYVEQPDGTFKRHIKRKRPGTLGLCAGIKYRYKIEAVPHLLCRGFTREETEDMLIELNYLGIENVLAIRGDDPEYKKPVHPDRTTNNYGIDLVRQIADMNRGKFQDDILDSAQTDFCIGVGGYPEKHDEAPNLEADIRYLKQKVDAGAHYVVTQMFFDNQKFFAFEQKCREAGITVPIIPGLKLLTKPYQLKSLPANFHVNIPDELVSAMENAESKAEVQQLGMAHLKKQAEELINAGVPCLHFYVMNDVHLVRDVVRDLKS
ncbi:MAG: methylenetetrahydrofolate reductase [NAD(P)H] [Candidatus Marinimicrobia bacterium]|nr:methylenetetrahydrofolate reductase [NAD(P)H] [Candidatus Neomarinimicrobiota bacterium]MCF7903151.1 methylenetetrahydrofolate reductase [NAD(P)H] [Candidatus Neomarinimicrobiota bacterium]